MDFLEYSKSDLNKAGEALRGQIVWTTETEAAALRTFTIANHWRGTHAKPMSIVRAGISGCLRALNIDGIPGTRLKRMRSIRKKLRRSGIRLNQIQDLGGCRCVVPTLQDVNALAEGFKTRTRHELVKENDYIQDPKSDGYRCLHLVYCVQPDYSGAAGKRIELQFRTRLQHSWATAVEVVGTFLKEDLKANEGNTDWLRLFFLMSGEIARAEGAPVPNGCPSKDDTVVEIKNLNEKLSAVDTLESIRLAFGGTDHIHIDRNNKPEFYLIKFDRTTHKVTVHGYDKSSDGARRYFEAEKPDQRDGVYRHNIVLVEADAIEMIKLAFPNYFGDVQLFNEMLRRVVSGDDVIEWSIPPRQTAPRDPDERPDMAWFRQPYHRKWFERKP